jgi:hypothetical protein
LNARLLKPDRATRAGADRMFSRRDGDELLATSFTIHSEPEVSGLSRRASA